MLPTLHIGCCGWSYLHERDLLPDHDTSHSSKLQAYCRLFDSVELNSSFYRIPRKTTADRWLKEAREVNPAFTFTVKVFRGITHILRFRNSTQPFGALTDIAAALQAPVLLFQTPDSFRPTSEAVDTMDDFFTQVAPCPFTLAWEPRGESWYSNPGLIGEICSRHDLIHCVDPFRNSPLSFGKEKTAYFRLHGFGEPSMYRYDFSVTELEELLRILEGLPSEISEAFIFFNNVNCYRNAFTFREMLRNHTTKGA